MKPDNVLFMNYHVVPHLLTQECENVFSTEFVCVWGGVELGLGVGG